MDDSENLVQMVMPGFEEFFIPEEAKSILYPPPDDTQVSQQPVIIICVSYPPRSAA